MKEEKNQPKLTKQMDIGVMPSNWPLVGLTSLILIKPKSGRKKSICLQTMSDHPNPSSERNGELGGKRDVNDNRSNDSFSFGLSK